MSECKCNECTLNICPIHQSWFYSETVKDHFFNPRNIFKTEKELKEFKKKASGKGTVGSPVCGDVMEMWIVVDSKTNKIKECRWRTFGCASAIASTSMLSEMVTENGGMTLKDAEKITPKEIMERLGGLPPKKIHCSVLGDRALRAAIKNYIERKNE